MSHVPEERLEEYRELRAVMYALDSYENNRYFARQVNPPYRIRQAKALLEAQMMEMRNP